jgi:CHAT domain-containing protein
VAKEAATRAALIAALNTATLVHFAGHARLVDRAPRLSHLVAAADGDGYEANIVSAADLSRLKLPQLSLVVLSSCGTTQRHSHWDMGRDGLSQALLNAGAGGVISSLWVVDDEEVTSLMEALHQRLAAGDSPPVALRAAELRMLETGRRGRAVSIGGIFRVETK